MRLHLGNHHVLEKALKSFTAALSCLSYFSIARFLTTELQYGTKDQVGEQNSQADFVLVLIKIKKLEHHSGFEVVEKV